MNKYLKWSMGAIGISLILLVGNLLEILPLPTWLFPLFMIASVILAFFRPRETFWLLVALIPLENIKLFEAGLSWRPYQILNFSLILILLGRFIFRNRRLDFLPKRFDETILRFWFTLFWPARNERQQLAEAQNSLRQNRQPDLYLNPLDQLLLALGLLSLISIQAALDQAAAIKGALILFSLLFLYWVGRNFWQRKKYILEGLWFLMLGAWPVLLFGLYQIAALRLSWPAATVMRERLNASFTEPNWFGIYLVFILALLLSLDYYRWLFFQRKTHRWFHLRVFSWKLSTVVTLFLQSTIFLVLLELILTAARSAWLGALAVFGAYGLFLLYRYSGSSFSQALKTVWLATWRLLTIGLLVVLVTYLSGLSKFHLGNRLSSAWDGWQKITVSCSPASDLIVNSRIDNLAQLSKHQCRHINLEDIKQEEQEGRIIKTVFRPDPNVGIRRNIYQRVWPEITEHWLIGRGLNNSAFLLGKDSLGHGLNTSNLFLETWFSLGILGTIALLILLTTFFVVAWRWLIRLKNQQQARKYLPDQREWATVFLFLSTIAFLIPNLFNAGLFLGIFWLWLALAVSIIEKF